MEAMRADQFDPAKLAALGHIEIIARWIVDGFMAGLHRLFGCLKNTRRIIGKSTHAFLIVRNGGNVTLY